MNAKTWSLSAMLLGAALAGAQGDAGQSDAGTTAAGPVRLARISFAEGNVSWRPDDASSWSQATPNLPLQQGAQVWVTGRGRAEIQFDDGSNIRLGNDAVVTLQSLFSDSQGEFTEIKLNDGTSSLHLKDKYSIYQVDTPFDSIKAAGPARFRIDVGNEVSVGVRTGAATVTANGGDTELRSGDFVTLRDAQDSVRVQGLPREDSWDRFDDERDNAGIGGVEHLPPNIAIVAGGIGRHGQWRLEGSYGWVWGPSVASSWRPYHDGHWVWVNPFGWTWCSDEEWGWAPYHYGTWAHFGWGWGWCPGPYHQYWSPATVSFSLYNGSYCWAPLCPEEVIYPSAFSIGFGGGNWWFNFSIGGCAVYRPGFRGFCEPVLFGRRDFDRRNWNNRFAEAGRFGVGTGRFVPRNAAWGASAVSENGFGQSGRFRAIHGSANQYFARGQSVTAASHAFSGPVTARATRSSMTPTHTFNSSERPGALNRALYRAPVSPNVARSSQPFGRTVNAGGSARSAGRSGSYMPSSGRTSNVDRARQSLGYSGRGAQVGNSSTGRSVGNSSTTDRGGARNTQGATGRSTGGSSGGSSNVERARQSLGYSGRANSGNSTPTSSNGRGGYGYGGSPRSDNRGSSNNGRTNSGAQSTGSSGRGGYGYSGGSPRSDNRGSSNNGRTNSGAQSGASSGSNGRGGYGYSGGSPRSDNRGSSTGGRTSSGAQSGASSGSSGRGGYGYSGGSSRSESRSSANGASSGRGSGSSGGNSRGSSSGSRGDSGSRSDSGNRGNSRGGR